MKVADSHQAKTSPSYVVHAGALGAKGALLILHGLYVLSSCSGNASLLVLVLIGPTLLGPYTAGLSNFSRLQVMAIANTIILPIRRDPTQQTAVPPE